MKADNYTGYVPTKIREPPKMFIGPTDEEMKEMIRKAVFELIPKKGKNKSK
mgnify:FL=1